MTIQPWETNAAAVAYQFMTAGGLNSPEQITEIGRASCRERVCIQV